MAGGGPFAQHHRVAAIGVSHNRVEPPTSSSFIVVFLLSLVGLFDGLWVTLQFFEGLIGMDEASPERPLDDPAGRPYQLPLAPSATSRSRLQECPIAPFTRGGSAGSEEVGQNWLATCETVAHCIPRRHQLVFDSKPCPGLLVSGPVFTGSRRGKEQTKTEQCIMKTRTLMTTLTLGAVLVWAAGCSKKEEASPPKAQETPKVTAPAASEMQKTAETVKTTAETAVETAKTTAATAADTAKAKAQELIDKAKSLVGENKYQDALNALQGLAGMSLTAEQQKVVDGLKKVIQEALAKKATSTGVSAVTNILGGK